ncbi:hypothetical protein A3731_14350 [Roseovarius sp. HI0049]|nr:hypothetical protein A3731_14350 [Roseovarius sp. HI0049]
MASQKNGGAGLTVSQAATLTGRSERWLQKLRKDGFIADDGRGSYTVVSLVRGIITHYEDALDRASKKDAANEVARARSEEIQQRVAIKKRDLIPQHEAEQVIIQLTSWVRAELYCLPPQLTRDRTQLKRYNDVVNGSLERLSNKCLEAAQELASGPS